MKRLGNMAQMKEQNKTSGKELSKMEISNLSDVEFKTLVIRILQELIGYLNKIKNMLAEMKLTLSEIMKNLQGTNSGGDKAENQINDLEHRKQKTTNQNNRKEKESPKMRIV